MHITPSSPASLRDAIQNSYSALLRKEKYLTGHWARKAVALDSKCEDAWLLMAAIASPKVSPIYLKRALEINPDSTRAQMGMTWALKRMETAGQRPNTLPGDAKEPFEIPEFILGLLSTSDSTTQKTASATRRFEIWQLFIFLRHPRQTFENLRTNKETSWLMPMLLLSAALILQVLVAGYFRTQAAASKQFQYPQDWQYWTQSMQDNYTRAAEAAQGPIINYIFPIIGSLTALWLGWVVLSALIRFISTLMGGGGSGSTALSFKMTAWASLPLAIRDILRSVFMVFAQHTIVSPGLSGFLSGSNLYVSQLVGLLDIFMIWQAALLVIGISKTEDIPVQKAALRVFIVVITMLLGQAGLGVLSASISGMLFSGI